MTQKSRSPSSWLSIRAATIALCIVVLACLLLYARSWPFPPLIQYARTERIEVRGIWSVGTGLIIKQILYGSDGQTVRDPFVRWEVRRYAARYVAGPGGPGGKVIADGSFIYKPCADGIVGSIWCRNYQWEWAVPSFDFQLEGSSLLQTAVASGDVRHLKQLIGAGANVNATGPLRETAIWSARSPEVARILAAAGANVEAPVDGFTALMSAAKGHDLDALKALLAAGANPNARDEHGSTPLLYALHPPLFPLDVPSPPLIAELLKAGASVNVRDREGYTPLMRAVQGGWADIVRLLLAAHADVNLRNTEGKTALAIAEREEQIEIARYLKKAGDRP